MRDCILKEVESLGIDLLVMGRRGLSAVERVFVGMFISMQGIVALCVISLIQRRLQIITVISCLFRFLRYTKQRFMGHVLPFLP